MRKLYFIIAIILFVSFAMSSSVFAQKEMKKVFEKHEKIKLKLTLGSLVINRSSDDQIHVFLEYTFDDDYFEAIFQENSRSLHIKENIYGNRNPRGFSKWELSVPDGVEIDLNTGTGNLTIEGVNAEIDGKTGTGYIEVIKSKGKFKLTIGTGGILVKRSEGEFKLSTGTGSVNIENVKGSFNVNAGTGSVKAEDITLLDDGSFYSGTGNAYVKAPKGDDFVLSVNSGTGNAILDMDGQKLQGYFELSANKRMGRIKSSVKFDDEEEYMNGGGTVIKKSIVKGKRTPEYYISTVNGKAELKE